MFYPITKQEHLFLHKMEIEPGCCASKYRLVRYRGDFAICRKEVNMEKNEKLKALDAAISQIEKQYGKGAVMKLGDPASQMNVETIPTGSLSLDICL